MAEEKKPDPVTTMDMRAREKEEIKENTQCRERWREREMERERGREGRIDLRWDIADDKKV